VESIQLLGPLQYLTMSEIAVDLGRAGQRAIFAMLAMDADNVVGVDQLIDRAWGAEPPRSARNMIHTYVSRLRGALQAVDAASAEVVRRHGGYMLRVDPGAVDLHRFRRMVAAARTGGVGDPSGAGTAARSRRLREALAIWRGTALGGLTGPWADRTRRLLELEKLSVLVECHDIELRSGGVPGLLNELRALATAHPDNEPVVRNLMIGLSRSGLRAEALATYEALRRRLDDQFGVDPTDRTRELRTRILRTDPALLAGRRGGVPAPTPVPGPPRVPHQLPRSPRLVGREQELAVLDGFVTADGGGSVRVVEGAPGIGKTALAVHWAHRVAHRFPRGQIFVNLRGAAPETAQSGEDVLRFLLWSLRVPVRSGQTAEEIEALFRRTVKDLPLLLILDDVANCGQVEPVLPSLTAGCVVMTTRSAPAPAGPVWLRPILRVRLPELTDSQAERLLAGILGEHRVAAETGAVAQIIKLCGRTPQALNAAAERALERPRLALADLAQSLSLAG
jgi:DNA-binding SARP family transcriptional activator